MIERQVRVLGGSGRTLSGFHDGLDVNLWHARTSSAEVRRLCLWVLGIVVGNCRLDSILGKHGAMNCEMSAIYMSDVMSDE
jgi:hypothetical protein